jgi:hypothetical protein
MKIKKTKLNAYKILTIIFFISVQIFAQSSGIRRSVTDSNTGLTFNTFRSDSSEAVFYVVLKQGEFLYDEPKNNAELIYSLNSDVFVEFARESGNFYNVKVKDKFHGTVTGWVRKGSLGSTAYYGRPLSDSKSISAEPEADLRKNPNWVKTDNALVYSDSLLEGQVAAVLKKGDLVYLVKASPGSDQAVYYTAKGNRLERGYLKKDFLSELALIPDGRTDFDALFAKFNPVLLKNDLDRAGFAAYNGIRFMNRESGEFTEDKVCREKGSDTLLYRYSLSDNINDIKKRTEIRSRQNKNDIAMFRFLPDEEIITTRDTVKCAVIEYVSVPKSAKIAVGGTEESSVTNSVTKLYLTKVEKDNFYVVFQRETSEYRWTYSRNIDSGELLKSKTDTEKIIKRLIAFRKH